MTTFRRRWAARLPVPTRRAVALGALLLPLLLLFPAPWGAVVVATVLVAALAVDTARTPAPDAVPVTRDLPSVVALGARDTIAWTVGNPTDRPLAVALADDLVPSLSAERRRVHVVVPPRGRIRSATAIEPTRRGLIRPRTLTLRVAGPWGLAARQAPRELPGRLEVHPTFRSRAATELRLRRERVLEVGLRAARGSSGGTEFESLREYQPDDEFRRIDWAATARAGAPIVRTYRPERNQTVLLLLDTGRVTAGLVEGVPRLDHAMDAAMAVTTAATHVGDRTGLVVFGSEVHAVVPPSHRRDQLARVVAAMYAQEPELAESAYTAAFTSTLTRFRRRSLLVLLTELASEAVQETLVPALPLVLRRHLVIVAGVRDPALDRWGERLVEDAGDAYAAAAAARLRGDRERAVAQLRGLGAQVVDAPPGELAGRLVDAYLDLKAVGRL